MGTRCSYSMKNQAQKAGSEAPATRATTSDPKADEPARSRRKPRRLRASGLPEAELPSRPHHHHQCHNVALMMIKSTNIMMHCCFIHPGEALTRCPNSLRTTYVA